jgi:uncharacterized Zn-binding protein involved in type VI secretion
VGKPLAKQGDEVAAIDTHIVLVSSPTGPVPTPLPSPFRGPLTDALSSSTFADEMPAATVGSIANNTPPHVPSGGPFQNPPSNKAEVKMGSGTVFIDDKPAVRLGDIAETCNDPAALPIGKVIANGTVFAGD